MWLDWLVFCDYSFSVPVLWCSLATPTILLGLLLPWTWGISSWLLQQSAATTPYLVQGVPHTQGQGQRLRGATPRPGSGGCVVAGGLRGATPRSRSGGAMVRRYPSSKVRRTVWRFLKKLEIELPYDPAIPLLGIRNEETRIERDTCTPMFIPALFTVARTWKQPRCPSADEWIRKLWYIYTMDYYSSIKKNTFESVLMRWMNLEPIIQSEVNQKEKQQYSVLTHIYGI